MKTQSILGHHIDVGDGRGRGILKLQHLLFLY